MKSFSLHVERLEDRITPVTFGVPWPDGSHLTLSFVPDGTSVNGQSSDLFQLLNSQQAPAAWQDEILRAFQTWAVNANINIAIVPDSGLPLGTGGAIQGDTRFGDIRIAAVPLSSGVVAQASPFDVTAGTWSGDVELNANYVFGSGTAGSQYDLFSVLLHEAGHVYGLDHSDDPASPMYESFNGVRTGLTAGDIANLQALYGPRQPDAFDAKSTNNTWTAAAFLNGSVRSSSMNLTAAGDITTSGETDWFAFRPQGNAGTVTIDLRTAGLSLLMPRLTVFDANLNPLGSTVALDHSGSDLVLQLKNASAGSVYYVKVEGGTTDVFGIGDYQLNISNGTGSPAGNTSGSTGFWQNVANDNNVNSTMATATPLSQRYYQADPRFDYTYTTSFSDSSDVDFYRVKAPKSATGTAEEMTVMVWTQQQPTLWSPTVNVFDGFGNAVAAQVVVNENGTYTIQVANAQANANYYVAVSAAPGSLVSSTNGMYFLGVDFGIPAVNLQTFASNTLTATGPADLAALTILQSQTFHFVLSASGLSAPSGSGVQLTITDQYGANVATVTASAGQSQSVTLVLGPGQYTFSLSAQGAPSSISYTLLGMSLSDPIGPQPVSTSGSTITSSGSGGTTTYIWKNGYYSFLGLTH